MTGFGKHVLSLPRKKINVEIRSLNSKNLDLNARIPHQYKEKELELRKMVGQSLVRGKIDFSVYVESTHEETSSQVNIPVVEEYVRQLKEVSIHTQKENDIEYLKMAVRMPDTLKTEREEIDETEYKSIQDAVTEALQNITAFRKAEGAHLKEDFELRISHITDLLERVITIDPERTQAVRERLRKGVEELKEKIDENRFEQELVYYIEKYDITEEKVRLKNHLNYFTETLNTADSNGKKLGFISQEIGREINTIGSKANYAPMQQLVVQMKDELEKIKEQLLNVL
ncbi:YicC family protein [Gangjinia marincola]|uniref:YicC family protein n=2 Tax=Gangjinia marincola TaxID=578463 RepID=A0ABP3XTV1_9FLAO